MQGASDPGSLQLACQRLMFLSQRAHIDRAPPMTRDLNRDMGAGPESIEAQTLTGFDSTQSECAIPDNPGTEQWRRFFVGKGRRNGIDIARRRHGIVRIAAVHLVAGKCGVRAEIFTPAGAKLASPAGILQPGDAEDRK